jgi:hypothetical protein
MHRNPEPVTIPVAGRPNDSRRPFPIDPDVRDCTRA